MSSPDKGRADGAASGQDPRDRRTARVEHTEASAARTRRDRLRAVRSTGVRAAAVITGAVMVVVGVVLSGAVGIQVLTDDDSEPAPLSSRVALPTIGEAPVVASAAAGATTSADGSASGGRTSGRNASGERTSGRAGSGSAGSGGKASAGAASGAAAATTKAATTKASPTTATGATTSAKATSAKATAHTAAAGVNLAAGRSVRVSSQLADYPAANVTDSNTGSYWEATEGFPQTLTVDLGSVQKVGRLVLALPPVADWNSRTQTIAVQGSTGGAYTTIKGATGYTFDAASAGQDSVSVAVSARTRYLRLVFSANDGWPAAQLAELEVHSG